MYRAKFLTLLKYIKAKKVFCKPKKCNILIFDRVGSENFINRISSVEIGILDTRYESINLYILFKIIMSFNLKRSYTNEYIKCVHPKVILTYIDNYAGFYLLKKSFPDVTTIFVQNGYRGKVGDIFEYFDSNECMSDFHVDYMFTIGKAVGDKYRQHVYGNVLPIGSFKNNFFLDTVKNIETVKNSLIFISQYRKSSNHNIDKFLKNKDMFISKNDFYSPDEMVVRFLYRYCKEHNMQFQICGITNEKNGEEYAYYRNIIGCSDWIFLPKINQYDSLLNVNRAEYVVFIDSTLGYEAIANYKKTISFSVRGSILNSDACRFGWPATLMECGPFWTSFFAESELERMLKFITEVDDDSWHNIINETMYDVITKDIGNKTFFNLLRTLGISCIEDTNAQQ